jgi:hypothetical protein
MLILLISFIVLCVITFYIIRKKQKHDASDVYNQNVIAFKEAKKRLETSYKLQRLFRRLVHAHEMGSSHEHARARIMLTILEEVQNFQVAAAICAISRSQALKNLEEKNATSVQNR